MRLGNQIQREGSLAHLDCELRIYFQQVCLNEILVWSLRYSYITSGVRLSDQKPHFGLMFFMVNTIPLGTGFYSKSSFGLQKNVDLVRIKIYQGKVNLL